nr:MAG TPA: hypothetical protein [Caudoviricetes sp.]
MEVWKKFHIFAAFNKSKRSRQGGSSANGRAFFMSDFLRKYASTLYRRIAP